MHGSLKILKIIFNPEFTHDLSRYINDKNSFELTPLTLACIHNHPLIVEELLSQQHINPNVQENDGSTALHIAVENENTKIAKLLLYHKKTNPNIRDERTGVIKSVS